MITKNMYQSFVLSIIFAVLGMALPSTVLGIIVVPEGPVCGFEEQAGRTIVEFQEGSKKLFANDDEAHAMIETTVSISSGAYDVTLVSYDGYSSRVTTSPQLDESWFAILKNTGTEVARTSAIGDLADSIAYASLTEQVEGNFIIASDIDSVVAYHAAYKNSDSSNSVDPVCAVFDKIEEPEPVTITASKVVCENEEDLPNWGYGDSDITISTAVDWVAQDNSCSLVSGWSFQWGEDELVSNPGDDFYGEAGDGWNTFGPTNENGVASVHIEDVEDDSVIWVREVLKDGYTSFTYMHGNNDNNVSAEFYCSTDVLNYDNFDYINNTKSGNEYYCVAFNTSIEVEPNTKPTITLTGDNPLTLTESDTFTDPGATADDAEDGNGLIVTDITGTVDTNTAGTYTITYNFTDSDGLAADEVTRTVMVEELPEECTDTVMARITISDIENWNGTGDAGNIIGQGNMTEDIYLGSTTTIVASGEWFPLYENGAYINDPDMTSGNYEDVPGLAVQRIEGNVRVLIFGSHPKDGTKEHVDGTIEFSGTEFSGFRSDDSGNNRLEKGFDDSMTYSAGDDEVWDEDGINNFWLTVTVADDGFYADYGESYLCPFEPNTKPTITLTGDNPLTLTEGDTFTDPGAIADDTEDGDITSDIVVGGDTVDPNTVGTYTIIYNVSDSEGLDADEVIRTVVVEEGEVENMKPIITLVATSTTISIGSDFDPLSGFATANDTEDGDITSSIVASSTVSTTTPGTYQVDYDVSDGDGLAANTETLIVFVVEEEISNTKPVITLLGDDTVSLTEGDTFTDPGATADDAEDGDITEDIIVGGDSVDTSTAGTYTITYNVTDEDGLAADEVVRVVGVKEKEIVTPTCTNCGGGGGGGPIMQSLRIFNEKLELLSSGAVLLSWETDKPATSRVVYDAISHKTTTYASNVGYASSTKEVSTLVKKHIMMIAGLLPDTQYFFRPMSVKDSLTKIGNEKTFALFTEETGEIIGECSYLKDYLRMGDNNDVEEVKKLQQFLKDFEGFSELEVTGVFDQTTFDAVTAFQNKYGSDVLTPWGIEGPTGYVYYTTQKKINEIHCKRAFPLSQNQEEEIVSFNTLLGGLQIEEREDEIDFNTIGRADTAREEEIEDIELALAEDEVEVQGEQNGQVASILGGVVGNGSNGTTTESVVRKGMFASVFGSMKNGLDAVVGSVKKFFTGNSANEDEVLDEENIEEDSTDTEEE